MRLLLWGVAAAALLATEPGKRLQRKAVDTFKDLKGKAFGATAQEGQEQEKDETGEKGEKGESVIVGANGKPTKDEKASKPKLRAVSNDEKESEAKDHETENDQAELEESRVALKNSIERHPEMGEEKNEDEAEGPRIEDEAKDKEAGEEEHGIDQKKAEELLEKLNAKPSAPEDELKSA